MITSRHIDSVQNTLSLLTTANMTVIKEILRVCHKLNNSGKGIIGNRAQKQ
jgi:hypothetical protein